MLELYVVVIVGVGTERHVQPLEMRVAGYWDTKGGMLTDSMIAVGIVAAPFPDDLGETKYQDTTRLAVHFFQNSA